MIRGMSLGAVWAAVQRPIRVALWCGAALLVCVVGERIGSAQYAAVSVAAWWRLVAAALFGTCALAPWFFLSDIGNWASAGRTWRSIGLAVAGLLGVWAVSGSLLAYLIQHEGWLR